MNTLVLCGGTGAHVAVAFVRLHALGYPFGFFQRGEESFAFPELFLVDQDAGDGAEDSTAWQLVRRLIDSHPGRYDWHRVIGRREAPEVNNIVTPLPVGEDREWFKPPYDTLATRFDGSRVLEPLTSSLQREIVFSRGMMGSPAVGALLFRLKAYDKRGNGLNHDELFDELLQQEGRVVVAGSGVGGTGASVGPTLAQLLADKDSVQAMAVMVLNWFRFELEGLDDETREKASLRNRVMLENANAALQFYGEKLSRSLATVPVGVPEAALLGRRYTSDMQQPALESFVHAVAALCALQHFVSREPYLAGLYQMGAVDPTKLDGGTRIPGGVLQSLANQAATLADCLGVWRRVLLARHTDSRVTPAISTEVSRHADPAQVAEHLEHVIANYRAHVNWLRDVLGVEPVPNSAFSLEASSRHRIQVERRPITLKRDLSAEQVSLELFHWTADWIRDNRSLDSGLIGAAGQVGGGYWPSLRGEGLTVAAEQAGELTRVPDHNITGTLEAFVNPQYVSANAWPHPVAAADYFRYAIENGNPVARRQLELMLVGLVSGELEPIELPSVGAVEHGVSLERLVTEFRRSDFPEVGKVLLVSGTGPEQVVVAFSSPHTLFCPVPYMGDEEGNRLWGGLWTTLSGSSEAATWATAPEPASWEHNDLAVRQVRSWLENLRRYQEGTAPPWTQILSRHAGRVAGIPFGAGETLSVYWDPGPARRLVKVSLPAREPGRWTPPPGTPTLEEPELMQQVPRLQRLSDQRGATRFEIVDFEVPGRTEQLRGVWKEHLEALQEEGDISLWSPGEGDTVILGLMSGQGVLTASTLGNTRVLDRATIMVEACTPFKQDPVVGSDENPGHHLYPSLPLKGDYLDLVVTEQGKSLGAALKDGDEDAFSFRPSVARDRQNQEVARWRLALRGRSDALPFELRSTVSDESMHQAHWMVWPSFRNREQPGWRAYYIYEHCSDTRLHVEPIWVDSNENHLRRRPADTEFRGRPLGFETGARRGHTAGPPVALSLRNTATDSERGLYMVPLRPLSEIPAEVSIGIDFGTSHSVAAVKVGGEARQIKLGAELTRSSSSAALTLHISENWSHVTTPEVGILALGNWLPTYCPEDPDRPEESEGFLPSELLTIEPHQSLQPDSLQDWLPVTDFVIPSMHLARADLGNHIVADFKWQASKVQFHHREPMLRQHYLAMLLEMVAADVVVSRINGIPQRIALTFTYPLRSKESEVEAYVAMLREVCKDASASLGIEFALARNEGIIDESRAARRMAGTFGEVSLVADLGGGTLDLFISSYEQEGRKQFEDVADSVKLGGDLLLAKFEPQNLLPKDGGWGGDELTKLKTWMRSRGAKSLFGATAGELPPLEPLGVSGFAKPAEAEGARRLIDRYFRLIVDYLARNLVAYLVGHWYPRVRPEEHASLSITVQLRGNGWRLKHEETDYNAITRLVQDQVRARAEELWELAGGFDVAFPKSSWKTADEPKGFHPKVAPILQVVGGAMPQQSVKENWFSHVLVDLEVLREDQQRQKVDWFQRVPFDTGGSRHVELDGIHPAIEVSSPRTDKRICIDSIEGALQGRVNAALQRDGVIVREADYLGPVSALVWEAVFESSGFLPGADD